MSSNRSNRILIWDKSTRLFHWLLVLVFCASIGTGLYGEFDWMDEHMQFGYLMLGLLLFRLLAGMISTDYGRFSRFPLAPASVFAYLRGKREYPGHNPLGSWMVIAMLLTLLMQTLTGLMTSDDIFLEGPWVMAVPANWSEIASIIHGNAWRLLLLLVSLHIAAIAFYYFVRHQNLVLPMFTGYKSTDKADPAWQPATAMSWPRFLGLIITAAVLSWLAISLP